VVAETVPTRRIDAMLTETMETSAITTESLKWTSITETSTADENSTSSVLNSSSNVDSGALSNG